MISTLGARWCHRLFVDGYRVPLVLAAALVPVVAVPHFPGRALFLVPALFLGLVYSIGQAFPGVVLAVLAAPVAAAVTLLFWSRRGRIARPGNSALLSLALVSVPAMLAFSAPSADLELLGMAGAAAVVLAVLWVARQLLGDEEELGRPAGAWRWVVAVLLPVAAVALVRADVPQQVRFELGRPAMTSFAERALADRSMGLPQPEWIGTYPVTGVEEVGTGLRFAVTGAGLFDIVGYAYLPDGPPSGWRRSDTYTHLSGAWYSWTDNGNF
ncbi:hypothetical protein [Kitasatospora sp. NPDC047058]|uniref:hypothetical protein n=1 Tax=Kitasatospora sp. NPDC047058 TaxID=3155620 RepID=UPI0033E17603